MSPIINKRTFHEALEGRSSFDVGSFVQQQQQHQTNKAPRHHERAFRQEPRSTAAEASYCWTGSTLQSFMQISSASTGGISSEVLTSGASIEKNLLRNQQVKLTHESINKMNDSYWEEAVMHKEHESSIPSYWTASTTLQHGGNVACNATLSREYWSGL